MYRVLWCVKFTGHILFKIKVYPGLLPNTITKNMKVCEIYILL